MPRTSDAKARLLEAATDLMWRHSYAATSVDMICEQAGVKKGSFYHFFESKEALALAVLDEQWGQKRSEMDSYYSASIAPLERFRLAQEHCMRVQREVQEKTGHVCGCPLVTLGSELGTNEGRLRARVEEIMAYALSYIETAIRDAMAKNQIPQGDAPKKARMIQNYIHGCLTQARITNSLAPLTEMPHGIQEMLGAPVVTISQ